MLDRSKSTCTSDSDRIPTNFAALLVSTLHQLHPYHFPAGMGSNCRAQWVLKQALLSAVDDRLSRQREKDTKRKRWLMLYWTMQFQRNRYSRKCTHTCFLPSSGTESQAMFRIFRGKCKNKPGNMIKWHDSCPSLVQSGHAAPATCYLPPVTGLPLCTCSSLVFLYFPCGFAPHLVDFFGLVSCQSGLQDVSPHPSALPCEPVFVYRRQLFRVQLSLCLHGFQSPNSTPPPAWIRLQRTSVS